MSEAEKSKLETDFARARNRAFRLFEKEQDEDDRMGAVSQLALATAAVVASLMHGEGDDGEAHELQLVRALLDAAVPLDLNRRHISTLDRASEVIRIFAECARDAEERMGMAEDRHRFDKERWEKTERAWEVTVASQRKAISELIKEKNGLLAEKSQVDVFLTTRGIPPCSGGFGTFERVKMFALKNAVGRKT